MGDIGETFSIVFKASPSLAFIHESELARLRIHRKRCLRSKAVQSLMRLGEIEENALNDTSLLRSKTVCAVPEPALGSDDRSDHEKSGHLRRIGSCISCAAGRGRMRSHFRLDPTTMPGGCLSVDISAPHAQGVWPGFTETPPRRSVEGKSQKMGKRQRFQGDIHFRKRSVKQFSSREIRRYHEETGKNDASRKWPSELQRALGTCAINAACCNRGPVRKVSWPRWSAKVFSRMRGPPKDSFAPRAREGFSVGVGSERSKTIFSQQE